MGGAADGVAGAEQPVDGHHPVVSPLVVRRRAVFRTARPGARTRGMRAHDVGFGRGQLRIGVLGIDVLRRPDDRLPDRHAQEIFPADLLLVGIGEGLLRHHADGPPAGLDLLQQGVIAQTGRHRMHVDVVAHQLLGLVVPLGLVLFPVGVLGVGLEVEEIGADRTVAVLEAGEDDAVLHLGHLGADEDRQRVGRRAAPGGVPGPPHAFAHRAGLEDVRRAAGGDDDGFRAEDVEVPVTDVEADGAGDAVGLRPVLQQVGHHDPVVDLRWRPCGRPRRRSA